MVVLLVGLGVLTYLSPLDKSCVVDLVRGVSERLTTLLLACNSYDGNCCWPFLFFSVSA